MLRTICVCSWRVRQDAHRGEQRPSRSRMNKPCKQAPSTGSNLLNLSPSQQAVIEHILVVLDYNMVRPSHQAGMYICSSCRHALKRVAATPSSPLALNAARTFTSTSQRSKGNSISLLVIRQLTLPSPPNFPANLLT